VKNLPYQFSPHFVTHPQSKLLGFYLTMGQYDIVAIAEFPDDETAARAGLTGGSQGFIRSETLRAFNEQEYRKIVASLP
jgi:uncharacterized protein with GYD domain